MKLYKFIFGYIIITYSRYILLLFESKIKKQYPFRHILINRNMDKVV